MDCLVVEAMLSQRVCVDSSHIRRSQRQLVRVVAQRPRARFEVGLPVVVLGVGGKLVWGALCTEVVGVGAPSVVTFVDRGDNGREQLPLLSRQP